MSAERVAQRIGMKPFGDEWREVEDGWVVHAPPVNRLALRTYLATGDRPLRVLDSMGKDVCLSKHPDQYAAPVWTATRYWTGGPQGVSAEGPTPAAAILALAERLEAERE